MMVKTDEFEIDNEAGIFCSTHDGHKAVFYGIGEKPELEEKFKLLMAEIAERANELGELILRETNPPVE